MTDKEREIECRKGKLNFHYSMIKSSIRQIQIFSDSIVSHLEDIESLNFEIADLEKTENAD